MKRHITPAWEIACLVTMALLMFGEAALSSSHLGFPVSWKKAGADT